VAAKLRIPRAPRGQKKGLEGVKKAFKDYRAFIRKLDAGALKEAHSRAAFKTASLIKEMVRAEYRNYSEPPAGLARKAITAGKAKGAVRPARMPRSPQSNMTFLSRAVIATRTATGYKIHVDPSRHHPDATLKFPAGVPLNLLAHWTENPTPRVISMTLRMFGYLKELRRGRAGPGRHKGRFHHADRKTSEVIVFNPKQRPVWRNVARKLMRSLPKYHEDLRERLQAIARAFGGKIGTPPK